MGCASKRVEAYQDMRTNRSSRKAVPLNMRLKHLQLIFYFTENKPLRFGRSTNGIVVKTRFQLYLR